MGRVKIISPGRFPATRENGHRGTNGANAISGIWHHRAFAFRSVARKDHSYSSFTAISLVLVETLPGENAIGHFWCTALSWCNPASWIPAIWGISQHSGLNFHPLLRKIGSLTLNQISLCGFELKHSVEMDANENLNKNILSYIELETFIFPFFWFTFDLHLIYIFELALLRCHQVRAGFQWNICEVGWAGIKVPICGWTGFGQIHCAAGSGHHPLRVSKHPPKEICTLHTLWPCWW